jgi:hypothetical protein
MFPTLSNFSLRFTDTLAGTPVRVDTIDTATEAIRTSRLDPASNPVYSGQLFQYTNAVPVQSEDGRVLVTAVGGTFAAGLLAGFLPNRDYETRVRDIQPLNTSSRTADNNLGRVDPGDAVPRSLSTEEYWIETDLASSVVVSIATPVHVLPKAGEGGIVSNAGGVVVPNLRFTGMIRAADNGRVYAAVRMLDRPLV